MSRSYNSDKPFKCGDSINVNGLAYIVTKISGNVVTLRGGDGKERDARFYPELEYPHNAKIEWVV